MFSHVTVGVSDINRASLFYDALLTPLGLKRRLVTPDGGPVAVCWVEQGRQLPRFYAYLPFDGQPAGAGNGSMVAFLAPSNDAVAASFAAGLESGGTSEGEPGPRPQYGEGYFGAYLRDPDGNKIHIVHRSDVT